MAGRAVIHIDIDAFFAAVELKKNPSYRGKAIVVGGDGDPEGRSVVSAASYEARARSSLPKPSKASPRSTYAPGLPDLISRRTSASSAALSYSFRLMKPSIRSKVSRKSGGLMMLDSFSLSVFSVKGFTI